MLHSRGHARWNPQVAALGSAPERAAPTSPQGRGGGQPAGGPGRGQLSRNATSAGKFIALEFGTVSTVAYLTSLLYHRVVVPGLPVAIEYASAAVLLAALYCGAALGLRDFVHLQNFRHQRLLWNAIRATSLAFAFLVSGMFLLKVSDEYSRGAFLVQFITVCLATLALRGFLISRQQRALQRGELALRRAFIVGDLRQSRGLSQRLRDNGIITVAQFTLAELEQPTGARALIDACRTAGADDIFVLPTADQMSRMPTFIDHLSQLPVAVHVMVPGLDGLLSASEVVEFGNVAAVQIQGRPLSAMDEALKRGFDIALAAMLLVVLAPLLLLVAAAIKLTDRGPVLFRQVRHGFNNEAITVLKFRTMRASLVPEDFQQATRGDPRVTWIGAWLRATSIDELPQLFNVLRGEMSIVGPRPHALAHNRMFEERIPPLSRRHNMKPGITGWAQVNLLRGETDTLEKMQKRIDYDLFYIDHWSFLFDLKIILLTAVLLLSVNNYRQSY
ncbi:exopolysaccharide biosynthesis polyprenyl glycosylphosphotransferase [Bradyrhizobium sp. HKCCYLS20291]|uniref:exopolysaccharide biosynthesis polyprenyl glycosylphosphotransferase n=1 Tax=Bradyrhizobium sp. HKCCYLS20291 TaxID=3420766 RepID=UPI003EBE07AA